jgi:hypothetical protein
LRAYKVLIDGRSPFTRWQWPPATADGPGAWVQARGPVGLCTNGVHACTAAQLPPWLGPELWMVELDGEIVATDAAVVASRARLLSRVARWDGGTRAEFMANCAGRAGAAVAQWPAGEPLLGSIERLSAAGHVAAVAYWSAVIAGERSAGTRQGPAYDAAFSDERSLQAAWLRSELQLEGERRLPATARQR